MTTRAEGNAKLLRLAAILDTADALHAERGEPGYCQVLYQHGCGTPACAQGHWAAANPDRWEFIDGMTYLRNSHLTSKGAAMREFALDDEFGEWGELFAEDGCDNAQTAAEAAAYIRAFVARRGE